ncbi:MAG: DNA polymerase III subunit gamma/tau [Pirellulales bacterium]|nr:DNA polymerase III subunit gamma/tau [Pirellulales bacterium]
MSNTTASDDTARTDSSPAGADYVVVARRYRPQTFADLVGQEPVSRALSNAISSGRVGHAYLFTGARGVGKTSTARILAKALNCERGPTPTPCNACDICHSISSGEDVDVLEIDGASNRGIDEIRELRQNVNIRPSRSRYKIYIIDEVHMLTNPAFNALLKTLEEPPEHVKFIFCTTEAEKIPITILSRCQRFDFAGIETGSISRRLALIAETEGVEAEPEALELLARRAAGSMRDSQSLLEQLLAFGGRKICVADVHAMLGTAAAGRVGELVAHLVDGDAAGVLGDLDRALDEGVDIGQLTQQLLGFFRDALVAAVGVAPSGYLHTVATEEALVGRTAKSLGVESILAVMQILDHALSRMRFSTQPRVVAELALVRIARLEHLAELATLIQTVREQPNALLSADAGGAVVHAVSASTAADDEKKKPPETVAAETETPTSGTLQESLTAESVEHIWRRAIDSLQDTVADFARGFDKVELQGPNRLVVSFREQNSYNRKMCQMPEKQARLERAVAESSGQRVRLEFVLTPDPVGTTNAGQTATRVPPSRERLQDKAEHPMIRRAADLFGARPTRIDEPRN